MSVGGVPGGRTGRHDTGASFNRGTAAAGVAHSGLSRHRDGLPADAAQ